MTDFKWFASFVLATTVIPALLAETHCPANAESLPFHLVNRYQMIVAVSVNNRGPYNFLLDTGTQITMLDPSLAAELSLNTEGAAGVSGAGFHASASFTQLDTLDAGSHSVANPRVLVFDLHKLRSADLAIRGILGEDFLEHFDMLIDNAHSLICLDDTGDIRAALRGAHAALLTPTQAQSGVPNSLVIEVRLSDGMRPVHLMLDSGSNAPLLYNTSQYMALGLAHGASWHGSGADGTQRAFVALPLQDVRIGSLQLPKVPFFTLVGAHKDSRKSDFDGLLTLGLFRRVFISHAEHCVVLDPW